MLTEVNTAMSVKERGNQPNKRMNCNLLVQRLTMRRASDYIPPIALRPALYFVGAEKGKILSAYSPFRNFVKMLFIWLVGDGAIFRRWLYVAATIG